MLKMQELTTPTSCINSAADDEPVFVLRANDEVAGDVVRMWAIMYRRAKEARGKFNGPRQAKYREALMLANQMDMWRAERGR